MMNDELNRKRLEWMAQAKNGDMFPRNLFGGDNNWAAAVSEAALWALTEIDRLKMQ